MKKLITFLLFTAFLSAEEYLKESALPVGWPEPGPFEKVVVKEYPESRIALTYQGSETFGFWKLFRHIKKNEIPMTAPVAMRIDDKSMKQQDMQFLYQSTEVGEAGTDDGVLVKDLKPMKAVCYAWLGKDSKETKKQAKARITDYLKENNLTEKVKYWRVLGYNSPSVPDEKQCWEMQALLKP